MGMGGDGRYGGGFGGGCGGGFGCGMQQNAMSAAQNNPAMATKTQWVSNAALNAVAAESTVGPDGKPSSALKLYLKDMLFVLILTPILLVLCVSGVLVNLGLGLATIIANGIANIDWGWI